MLEKANLESDLKSALKSGDKNRLNTIRMVLTEIKLAEVEKKKPLDEEAILAIFQKQAKMRRESMEDANKAKREDLIPTLEEKLSILNEYLPEPLSEEDLNTLVVSAIEQANAQSLRDMGNVMKIVMAQVGGRADGKMVSQLVRTLLVEASDTNE